MSTIGFGYGSEWHLLRFLGYHRDILNRSIECSIPNGMIIDWLGTPFEANTSAIAKEPPRFLDREFEGINFLPPDDQRRLGRHLDEFWPTTGSKPNWDAVGRVRVADEEAWLLVEAKSHLVELRSTCGARPAFEGGGRDRIAEAFRLTQARMGIGVGPEAWLSPYYQFCNRISYLQFLCDHGIPTRLLFLYFLGDRFPTKRAACCPEEESGWRPALREMELHTGWGEENPLAGRVHRAFLPVCPRDFRQASSTAFRQPLLTNFEEPSREKQ